VNIASERTDGNWAAVRLYAVHMEELFNVYWTG